MDPEFEGLDENTLRKMVSQWDSNEVFYDFRLLCVAHIYIYIIIYRMYDYILLIDQKHTWFFIILKVKVSSHL